MFYKNIYRTQKQILITRIVSNTKKYDDVTPVLKNLRWLPVKTILYFRGAVYGF